MPLDQLADTRRTLLESLKSRGAMTLNELAEALAVTREGARQQLLQLELAGWVVSERDASSRGRVGRPASVFKLTEAGEALFPKHYDVLASALMEALEALGPQEATALLGKVAEKRVAAWEAKLAGRSAAERARALAALYFEGDPFISLEKDGGDLLLIERNCPYLNVAQRHPALCSVSVHVLARLMNAQVVREERFQEGHRRCVFRIKVGSTRAPRTFRLEGPISPRSE